MASRLPPGIRYLSQKLHILLGPPVLATAVLYCFENVLQLVAIKSQSLRAFLLLLSWPVVFHISHLGKRWSIRRRAAILGAKLPKNIDLKWPAGIDLTIKMLALDKDGYLGDPFFGTIKELGGIFDIYNLYEDRILLTEPEYVKAMLATDFNNFEKGERQRMQLSSVLGTGVFCSDGDMWKFHRSMTRPFFSKDRISHFDIFGSHADEAIDLIILRLQEGFAVDIQDTMLRFTLDSATEFLFGSCVHSLSAGLAYPYNAPRASNPTIVAAESNAARHPANKFAFAFGEALKVTGRRSSYGSLWPLFEMFSDKTNEHMKVLKEFVDPIVREAIEKRKKVGADKRELDDSDTLLDNLVSRTDDLTILRDETLNILIAGRDTTAALLTFVVYMLCMNPHVLSRLRTEILSKLGSSRRPTYEELRDMKYLRAVINETLRLYPSVPFDMRENLHETTWPNKNPNEPPHYIPAGTKCIYSALLMHRREELWGPDAEVFDPDRFLDERLHKYLTPNPFIFVPFHAGPRICLGQQFAYNEASFMIIRLLQRFSHLELAPDAQPPDSLPPTEWAKGSGRRAIEKIFVKSHLTSYAKGGVWVRMREAPTVETV